MKIDFVDNHNKHARYINDKLIVTKKVITTFEVFGEISTHFTDDDDGNILIKTWTTDQEVYPEHFSEIPNDTLILENDGDLENT